MIGHTQPRRIAARTVAERIAEELGTPLGGAVGYKVRFTDQVGDDTLVKLMTDGILLAEIQRDRTAPALRHAHHRRGARAQPQHRLHPRLPQAAAAAPAGPQGRSSPRRRSTRSGSREHFGDAPDRRGVRPDVPGRGPLPAARRPGRRRRRGRGAGDQIQAICDAVDELAAEGGPATSWSSSPASGRSATPPTRCAHVSDLARTPRSCRCTPGCPPPSSTGSSSRTPAGGSCSPPTSPRPR